MLCELSCAELAEHELYERLEMESEDTRKRRKEEERLMSEAMGMVKKTRKRTMR
jgi:hypothetical protein